MRFKHLIAALCVPALLTLNACQKERLATGDTVATTNNGVLDAYHKAYNDHGKIAQKALVAGLANPELRAMLREQAMVMEDGDTEVLLKDFLAYPMVSGQLVQDFLLNRYNEKYSDARIALDDLTAFSEKFPSIIIGVRGPVFDWETSEHIPTMLFLPIDFKETATSLPGMQPDGQMVDVDLVTKWEKVVLTLAPSERHNAYGALKVNASLARLGGGSAVDINEVARGKGEGGGGTFGSSSADEPISCPITSANMATPTQFTATSNTSGITLTWDPGIYTQYSLLETWARWVISRDGTPIAAVYANEAPTWTDQNLTANQSYTYTIRFSFVTTTGNCSSPYAVATATAPGQLEQPQNFNDDVQLVTKINLFWTNPNQFYTKISLQRYDFDGETWTTIDGNLAPGTTDYPYTSWDFGKKHLFRLRYYGVTGWSNPSYDIVMNPARNSGQPLAVRGFTIGHLQSIESQALGQPELHISATNGSLNGATQLPSGNLLHNNTFVPLQRCGGVRITDFRIAGSSMIFINQWIYNLYGMVCRASIVETDQTDPFKDDLTQSSGQTYAFSLGATIPIKPNTLVNAGSINTSSNFQFMNTASYTINTVDGDLNLGNTDMYYWDYNNEYVLPTITMKTTTQPGQAPNFCN